MVIIISKFNYYEGIKNCMKTNMYYRITISFKGKTLERYAFVRPETEDPKKYLNQKAKKIAVLFTKRFNYSQKDVSRFEIVIRPLESKKQYHESQYQKAENLTLKVQSAVEMLENVLYDGINTPIKIEWDSEKYGDIDKFRDDYRLKDPGAIETCYKVLLRSSSYPMEFEKKFDLKFAPGEGILVIDYDLPSIDLLPDVKEIKYMKTRDETKTVRFTETQLASLFDSFVYNLMFRTIYEIFAYDKLKIIEFIIFNGWAINVLDKSIGKKKDACIISLQISQHEFNEIDLKFIDPKKCFKRLTSVVGRAKLTEYVAVQPIRTNKQLVCAE